MEELPPSHQPIAAETQLSLGQSWAVTGMNRERLRLREVRPGEAFTLQDAGGAWFRARLQHTPPAPGPATALLFETIACPESPLTVALFQAVLARERMFWVVQKATELGASWIVPLFTDRSLTPEELPREKAHRWPAAIVRAVAQCRRGTVPCLLPPLPLAEALGHPLWREAEARWALVEGPNPPSPPSLIRSLRSQGRGEPRVPEALLPLPCDRRERSREGGRGVRWAGGSGLPRTAALLVGPEGGWTPEEIDLLERAGATAVRLGGRVLRAETAALAGLVALQGLWGDLATR